MIQGAKNGSEQLNNCIVTHSNHPQYPSIMKAEMLLPEKHKISCIKNFLLKNYLKKCAIYSSS